MDNRYTTPDMLNARISEQIKRATVTDFLREHMIWVVLLATVIVISIASPLFLTPHNILNILRQGSILGIVAIGMTFAMIGGSFDLSVGATMGLATVIVIQSLYAVWGATLIYTEARHVWVRDMFPPLAALGTGSIGPVPIMVIVFLLIAILGHLTFSTTTFGRYLYATGGNRTSARLSGINTERVQLVSYILSGLGAAVAGIVIAARVQNVDPSFGVGFEFDALTAVVLGGTSLLGGRGSISGTVAGVLLLGVLANAMTLLGISIQFQLMIRGIILIVAVAIDVLIRKQRG
jgi:ribose/xylose/arabinose/galactoside ABC-type transport system permease subunit